MNCALYPSCSTAAKASLPVWKMLYTFCPSNEALGVIEPIGDNKYLALATEHHSASRVDCIFGFLLLSGSTPTDPFLGGKDTSISPLYVSIQFRLWHNEEFILVPSNLVVAGDRKK